MFEDTKLFGISMAPRASRRALVVITYGLTACLIAAFVALALWCGTLPEHSALKRLPMLLALLPFFVVQALIPGSGCFRGVFGRFVPEQTFTFRVQSVHTIGLAPNSLEKLAQGDERERAVRNSAYFLAFKVIAWYAFVYFLLCVFPLVDRGGETARIVAAAAAIPMVVMLFTLPQAIVLWMEPDLPEEAR